MRCIAWISMLGTLLPLLACGKKPGTPSPDGSMFLQTRVNPAQTVVLSIRDADGNLLHEADTGASGHQTWSARWVDDTKVLFESSDIDPSYWIRQKSGRWKKANALHTMSPDGKFVIYTFWDSRTRKTLRINLLKCGGDPSRTFGVVQDIPTSISVGQLIDCARWDGNDRFLIQGADKEHRWELQADGSWKQTDQ